MKKFQTANSLVVAMAYYLASPLMMIDFCSQNLVRSTTTKDELPGLLGLQKAKDLFKKRILMTFPTLPVNEPAFGQALSVAIRAMGTEVLPQTKKNLSRKSLRDLCAPIVK